MSEERSTEMIKREEQTPAEAGAYKKPVVMVPPVDIYEKEDGVILLADMPGVPKDKIDVQVDKNVLTIRGEIGEIVPKDITPLYAEFNGKAYERAFTLSPDVDVSKIEAQMNAGVLKIFLPKAEDFKPRRIEVQAG